MNAPLFFADYCPDLPLKYNTMPLFDEIPDEVRFVIQQIMLFISALHSKATGVEVNDQFIYDQIDYILGSNSAKQSFIVGFCSGCSNSPQFPHHRNVYLKNDNHTDANKAKMMIPQLNKQFGYLVGGTWTSSGIDERIIGRQ